MTDTTQGVTITDRSTTTGALAFDLRDILDLIGERGRAARWRVTGLECMGGSSAVAFHQASDDSRELGWAELVELASNVGQIIDGEFSGFLPEIAEPWVIIRAVDSSAFDVVTNDAAVLAAIRLRFSQVEDLPA